VLPFANIGGDPEQEYFVDGVTESLTTDLSRISGAFVIGRSTAFSYKGKSPDLRQIGRELNVRYVLEGSVQRAGNRMRVNVQLIEAETGAHLWAERFDKPLADLFDMQDEIVARLANRLRAELIEVEARRAEKSPNPDSMDLVFQGNAALNRGNSPDLLARARGFYERALDLDRANIGALIGAALLDLLIAWSYQSDDPGPLWAAAEAKLSKALAAAPNNARAHFYMGLVLVGTNRAQRAIEEYERALALEPNLASARSSRGMAYVFIGRAEETEAQVLEALRLGPPDTVISTGFHHVGYTKNCLGEYEAAWVGSESRSTRIATILGAISLWPPVSPIWAGSTKPGRRCKPASPSTRISRSNVSALAPKATIPCTSPSSRASSKACAWRACRRGERASPAASGDERSRSVGEQLPDRFPALAVER
jgi:TolB-like protein